MGVGAITLKASESGGAEMAVLEEVPDQAPMDLIIGSRELFRGKIRGMHALNAGIWGLLAVFQTTYFAGSSMDARGPYWPDTAVGLLIGIAIFALPTRWRATSPTRQHNAIQRAWGQAKRWNTETRYQLWMAAGIMGVLVVACVVVWLSMEALGGWTHAHAVVCVLYGFTAGVWIARTLCTFRWATWFGEGAIDPQVAVRLVRAFVKGQKVQHFAAIYAQTHPHTNGDPS